MEYKEYDCQSEGWRDIHTSFVGGFAMSLQLNEINVYLIDIDQCYMCQLSHPESGVSFPIVSVVRSGVLRTPASYTRYSLYKHSRLILCTYFKLKVYR